MASISPKTRSEEELYSVAVSAVAEAARFFDTNPARRNTIYRSRSKNGRSFYIVTAQRISPTGGQKLWACQVDAETWSAAGESKLKSDLAAANFVALAPEAAALGNRPSLEVTLSSIEVRALVAAIRERQPR